jgi:hypothetical protein
MILFQLLGFTIGSVILADFIAYLGDSDPYDRTPQVTIILVSFTVAIVATIIRKKRGN